MKMFHEWSPRERFRCGNVISGASAGDRANMSDEDPMEKIDIVLPWVDGADPRWREEKNRYAAAEGEPGVAADADTCGDCRYRDFGLLRYWFRSVERFAPWADRIFFVTCGQKPEWLDESNPRLRLVDHRDYIPAEYLPTFHSDTIELNLFRIPDLAERFVLFNDDVFLLRPVPPEFFFRKGLPVLPCEFGVPFWLGCNNISRIALNNTGVLKSSMAIDRQVRKHWRKFFGVGALGFRRAMKNLAAYAVNHTVFLGSFGHLAQPHLKSTFAEIWRRHPELMDRVSRRRFRSDDGVNHWLACGWNMLEGRFSPMREERRGVNLNLEARSLALTCETIDRQRAPQVCINDTNDCETPAEFYGEVARSLERLLPERSSFEK